MSNLIKYRDRVVTRGVVEHIFPEKGKCSGCNGTGKEILDDFVIACQTCARLCPECGSFIPLGTYHYCCVRCKQSVAQFSNHQCPNRRQHARR